MQVLALSVREAIGQAVESLEREGTTGRQDLCMRGGRSTDGEKGVGLTLSQKLELLTTHTIQCCRM